MNSDYVLLAALSLQVMPSTLGYLDPWSLADSGIALNIILSCYYTKAHERISSHAVDSCMRLVYCNILQYHKFQAINVEPGGTRCWAEVGGISLDP